MSDSISRQQVIGALRNYLVGKNVPCDGTLTARLIENEVVNKLPSVQPETYWKEQCQSYEKTINKLRESLSAQPEIIRCKDCKHRDNYGCCKHWKGLAMGDIPIATDDNDFCSYAERREVTE